MTNTQHTPGPWRAQETAYKPWTHIVSEQGSFIADTDRHNARLIAASPKLLAACQRALAEAVADDQDGWYAEVRAAIAEATGR